LKDVGLVTAAQLLPSIPPTCKLLFIVAEAQPGHTDVFLPLKLIRMARDQGVLTWGLVLPKAHAQPGWGNHVHGKRMNKWPHECDAWLAVPPAPGSDGALLGMDAEADSPESPDAPIAFVRQTVQALARIIATDALVNIDLEDLRTVFEPPCQAMAVTTTAHGPDRGRVAAERAMASLRSDGWNLKTATSAVVMIKAQKGNLRLSESRGVVETVLAQIAEDHQTIYGIDYDETLARDVMCVTVILGVIESKGKMQ
jgi:cell division GTPase FtsZ